MRSPVTPAEIDRDLSEFTHHADRRARRARARARGWRPSSRCASVSRRLRAMRQNLAADPLGRGREARRRAAVRDQAAAAGAECADPIQSRDRRSRPHPCRQSRARAQDAAQRHHQRSARRRKGRCASKVVEQAEIMRTQITHHLDRARVAARSSVIGDITDVDQVLQALKRTLDRIYEERGLDVEVSLDPGAQVPGREAGFRGDGRQPARQCLQMGELAGEGRASGVQTAASASR